MFNGPARRLARRMALPLGAALVLAIALLLGAWGWIGRHALQLEHEAASLRMANLFETSLRNAMLARDLPGLQRLVESVAHTPGLRDAALLHPSGEVRFAAQTERLHRPEAGTLEGLCLKPGCAAPETPRLQWLDSAGERWLRVVYPVLNQPRCAGCHGQPTAQPVNGVLVLDFAPMDVVRQAREYVGTWMLPAALAALLGVAGVAAAVLRQRVLVPLQHLGGAVSRLGDGDLAARSGLAGDDEIAQLGQGFDRMAGQIAHQVQALSAQGEFLQTLLDAMPDAVLLIGHDHRIIMANQAYARLLGRPVAQVVGQPCHRSSRNLAEPCPATLVECPLAHCRQAKLPPRTVMAFQHANGSSVNVEIVAAPLRSPQGEPQVIEVIRALDDQLRFSQEQRLASIGLLANGVAHEIHNPMASIRLALQSSLRSLRDGSLQRDELEDYLRLVDEQVDRCVHITQRLLRLSQPAARQAQPVDVADAVDDVLTLLGEELRRAGVATSVQITPPGLRALGDAGELRQVLINLTQNAVHAMPQGGKLWVQASSQGGRASIAVIDNGCGIAPDQLPLIFLPFYSLRGDGRRGTGLGLAICKSQVQAHGGQLRASSQVGQGSRFEILLPDADAPPPDLSRGHASEVGPSAVVHAASPTFTAPPAPPP